MEIGLYNLDDELESLQELLSRKDISVDRMLICGVSSNMLVVFSELVVETLGRESEQLERVKAIAHELRTDDKYSELKNANQRVLYLLDMHNVPKSIATDVIDYLKVMEVLD